VPVRQNIDVHLCLAILLAAQLSATEIRKKPDATFEEIVSLPLVYTAPNLDRVVEQRDLKYKDDRRLDVYRPADAKPHPVVFFVHGGVGPQDRPKDWGVYRSWGRTVAASGLVAVIPNQRLGFPARHYEEGAADVRDAMEFVRSHRRELRAADRFCILAFSGGGPMLAPLLKSAPADVKCLVGFYPILDTADTNNPEAQVTDEQRREYSAVATLTDHDAPPIPILIARGGHDQIPGVRDWIDRFVAVALQKNANLTLLNHPTGRHGFEFLDDDDRSREIVITAIDFMKRHLGE
jgi:dienelactone hydrolase